MRTITYYEVDDVVEIIKDYCTWKKGDIARITHINWIKDFGYEQILSILPLKEGDKNGCFCIPDSVCKISYK